MRQILMLIVLGLFALPATDSAWADCRTDYDQAVNLLDSTKKKSLNNEHPNPDDFARDFQALVDKLEEAKCMPELTSLVKYIHAEQQKYPAPEAGKRPNPIVD